VLPLPTTVTLIDLRALIASAKAFATLDGNPSR
jgi:hypothetical protein